MTIEEAYNVGKKYGFTFNGIGPSLSIIDKNIGICLNLLDQKYGYLKRNITFDNIDDLDNFLKKYSFYLRNKDKESIFLSLDDYEISNPNVYYSFDIARENKKAVELTNKKLLIEDIKSFLNNFYLGFDKIKAEIKEKLLIEQDYYNKLNYYKKLLYKAYNQDFEENIIKADESVIDKITIILENFKNEQSITISSLIDGSLNSIEGFYKELISKCQKLLLSKEILSILYEKKEFEHNTKLLNQMIDYLINNPTLTDKTQTDLQTIKDIEKPVETFESFKTSYEERIKELYSKIDLNNVLSYNSTMYKTAPVVYEVYKEAAKVPADIGKLKDLYNNLDEVNKRALNLLYSPIKPILNYIIEQAYKKNTSFNFQKREFKNIYDEIVSSLELSENLVFKLKYFRDINLNSYEEFIKSLVKVAKIICSSYLRLPFDIKLYSLNFDDCLITGSDKIIQKGDDLIRIVDAKNGSYIIYSPIKINLDYKSKLFSLKDNKNVIYFPSFSNKCILSNVITRVSIFEEGYTVMNVNGDNLLVVTNFNLQNKVSFTDTIMMGKNR